MEMIHTMATFNVLMLLAIFVVVLATIKTGKACDKLKKQNARDENREDKILDGNNRLAH